MNNNNAAFLDLRKHKEEFLPSPLQPNPEIQSFLYGERRREKERGKRGKDGEKWEGQREGERGRVRLKEIGRAGRKEWDGKKEGRRGRDGRREEKEGRRE